MTTEFGDPVSTEQFCWYVLKQIKSPVVGDLTLYSSPGYALAHCKKDEVYYCLSGGEKCLIDIAHSFWSSTSQGEGLIALSGLDRGLRRKIWVAMGYLLLGRDILKDEHLQITNIFDDLKGEIPHRSMP